MVYRTNSHSFKLHMTYDVRLCFIDFVIPYYVNIGNTNLKMHIVVVQRNNSVMQCTIDVASGNVSVGLSYNLNESKKNNTIIEVSNIIPLIASALVLIYISTSGFRFNSFKIRIIIRQVM